MVSTLVYGFASGMTQAIASDRLDLVRHMAPCATAPLTWTPSTRRASAEWSVAMSIDAETGTKRRRGNGASQSEATDSRCATSSTDSGGACLTVLASCPGKFLVTGG